MFIGKHRDLLSLTHAFDSYFPGNKLYLRKINPVSASRACVSSKHDHGINSIKLKSLFSHPRILSLSFCPLLINALQSA